MNERLSPRIGDISLELLTAYVARVHCRIFSACANYDGERQGSLIHVKVAEDGIRGRTTANIDVSYEPDAKGLIRGQMTIASMSPRRIGLLSRRLGG